MPRGRPAEHGVPMPTIQVQVPVEYVELLNLRAGRDGTSRSAVVRDALRAWLGGMAAADPEFEPGETVEVFGFGRLEVLGRGESSGELRVRQPDGSEAVVCPGDYETP